MQQEGGSSEGLDEDDGTYRPSGQSRVDRGRNSRVAKMERTQPIGRTSNNLQEEAEARGRDGGNFNSLIEQNVKYKTTKYPRSATRGDQNVFKNPLHERDHSDQDLTPRETSDFGGRAAFE